MGEIFSITLSALALSISCLTAWVTLFRRGQLKMTQPTVVYFGPDRSRRSSECGPPKIFLRTLLFSTGKKGQMIESMHLKLSRNETVQNFNIWVYGDDQLTRGSGLFVGESGIVTNHHFLTPKDASSFSFVTGTYTISVYARLLGATTERLLWSQEFTVSAEHANDLRNPAAGLYFDWGPDSRKYLPHVEIKSPSPSPEEIIKLLVPNQPTGTKKR